MMQGADLSKRYVIKVNMTGKDYMKLVEQNKISFRISDRMKAALPYFICSFLLLILFCVLLPIISGSCHKPYTPIDTKSYTTEQAIIYIIMVSGPVIAACLGIAWVIHGAGLILIRR